MNKKAIKKVISIVIPVLFLCVFFIMPFTNYALAEENTDFTFGGILTSVREFFNKGKEQGNSDEIQQTFIEQTAPLFNTLLYIGFAVAVGTLIILGVQYAQESPEKRADLRARLVGFLIATVLLGAAIPIWAMVVKLFSGLTGVEV